MFTLLLAWCCLVVAALAGSCHHTLELTWGPGSPDGFERDMIFINGQFPGPTLEINQGEWVEIEVINNMPFNSTIHAHGIEQINTPWADGVPGFSQRPIQPGESFTYKWHAHQHGSYFYHAHSRGQIDDGCYGAMTIKPKAGTVKPFDRIAPAEVELLEAAEAQRKPFMVSDWRHKDSQHTWDLQVASGLESAVCQDSILVNGKGAVNCWSREEITQFTNPAIAPLLQQNNLTMTDKGCFPPEIFEILLQEGGETNISALPEEVFHSCTPTEGSREIIKASCGAKWLALDIISSASIDTFALSIDEHPLWIYAVDGHYIEPMKVDVLHLANGDRFSVFVQLDKVAKDYGIRIASIALPQLLDTIAVLSYDGGYGNYRNETDVTDTITSVPSINRAGVPVSENSTLFKQEEMVSFPPVFPQPAPEPDQTSVLTFKTVGNSYTWAMNNTPFDHAIDNSEVPLLYQDPYEAAANVHAIATKNNTWVDLVFVVPGASQPPHPIHKHGNKVFVLGAGEGAFNWTTVADAAAALPKNFNFKTPAYRDGFATPPTALEPSWLAIRYHVTNPGAFMLHCHIQSHLNGGMAMTILDGVDEWPQLSEE